MGVLSPSKPARSHLDPNSNIIASSSPRNDEPDEVLANEELFERSPCWGEDGLADWLWRRLDGKCDPENRLLSPADMDDTLAMLVAFVQKPVDAVWVFSVWLNARGADNDQFMLFASAGMATRKHATLKLSILNLSIEGSNSESSQPMLRGVKVNSASSTFHCGLQAGSTSGRGACFSAMSTRPKTAELQPTSLISV